MVLKELRDVAILVVMGFAMALLWYRYPSQYVVLSFFTATMWVFLWKGNALISNLVSTISDWFESPLKTFLIAFASTVGYTLGIVFVLVKSFEATFDMTFGSLSGTLYSSVIVTLLITLFMYGRSFLLNWRQAALEHERIKRENISARYESLKSQVNPHFLFNSLNVLTNLVYENPDTAVKFIKQLSDVYRYVLDTRDRELVPKEEELKFLASYLFLQKMRFEENLRVQIDLANTRTLFPPLVLQMLIENAIKHNVITAEHPLTVTITGGADYVEVKNNLQRKRVLAEESTGIGLSNISQRYQFLAGRDIQIVETFDTFTVRLPLIAVPEPV